MLVMEENINQWINSLNKRKERMKKMKKRIFSKIVIVSIILGIGLAGQTYAAQTKGGETTRTGNNQVTNQVEQNNQVDHQKNGEENGNTIVAKEENKQEESKENEGLSNHDIGLLAAALATGLACIGAGIAVAMVASSAIGAISENPGLLGKTIIFAGLAEGIAIYGLIISIMILNKV